MRVLVGVGITWLRSDSSQSVDSNIKDFSIMSTSILHVYSLRDRILYTYTHDLNPIHRNISKMHVKEVRLCTSSNTSEIETMKIQFFILLSSQLESKRTFQSNNAEYTSTDITLKFKENHKHICTCAHTLHSRCVPTRDCMDTNEIHIYIIVTVASHLEFFVFILLFHISCCFIHIQYMFLFFCSGCSCSLLHFFHSFPAPLNDTGTSLPFPSIELNDIQRDKQVKKNRCYATFSLSLRCEFTLKKIYKADLFGIFGASNDFVHTHSHPTKFHLIL